MTSFSFLHAADLHLDSPLRGLEADAPADKIRGAARQAMMNLVELALREKVAFARPTMMGRSGSPFKKSTITSWPMRGMK